jgi:hypothetical protein
METKNNPEKEALLSASSAASARQRRTGATGRSRPAQQAGDPDALERDAELPARPSKRSTREDAVAVERELSHEEIARVAYAFWEARGGQGGSPEEDWLRAEQQLRDRV